MKWITQTWLRKAFFSQSTVDYEVDHHTLLFTASSEFWKRARALENADSDIQIRGLLRLLYGSTGPLGVFDLGLQRWMYSIGQTSLARSWTLISDYDSKATVPKHLHTGNTLLNETTRNPGTECTLVLQYCCHVVQTPPASSVIVLETFALFIRLT